MIRLEEYHMPAASLGKENPLPDICGDDYLNAKLNLFPSIPEEERTYLGKGMIRTLLPYKIQDGYDRVKKDRAFHAVVLENDLLKAVFLPEIGGRLWSLYDKRLNRELLYKNPVFQPANLALRNAWFSGGVEFNVGIRGHNMLTCSPLFADILETPKGPVLSMYEYERVRGVVYTVNAWLPDGSDVLYLHNTIENTEDREKWMYWWSNIAVPETEKTRVIVHAHDAINTTYQENRYGLGLTDFPQALGTEASYPTNIHMSHDFFFRIPDNEMKWVAAPAGDGIGLLQCSTDLLKGRKLFLWGMGEGGRHWAEWLSEPEKPYIEIQAGLLRTQMEHVPMPGRTEWSWTEAYTALQCAPEDVHGEWDRAIETVEGCIRSKNINPHRLPFTDLTAPLSVKKVSEGSGWGYTEELLRAEKISRYHTFTEPADGDETLFFRQLIKGEAYAVPDTDEEPAAYMTDASVIPLLKAAPADWYSKLQLGLALFAQGDSEGAEDAFRESIRLKPSAWAYRNLAMLEKNVKKRPEEAVMPLLTALFLKEDCLPLWIETGSLLTSLKRDSEYLALTEKADPAIRENGRVGFYRAIALIHLERYREAAEIINEDFEISDVREGEISVSEIWFMLYRKLYAEETGIDDPDEADRKYPLSRKLDFRMHP